MSVGLIGDVLEWLERWLFEEIGKHLGLEGLKWLLKQPFVGFPIWAWLAVLALAVILVVVSAVGLVKTRPLGERALAGEHILAGVFWLLIIVLALYALR